MAPTLIGEPALEQVKIVRSMADRQVKAQRSGVAKRATSDALRALARLAGFACLIAVLSFVLNAVINSGLRRIRTSDFGVSNRIVDGQVNADIVISGSSRALAHYDARIIQEATGRTAFNIGLNGSQTDMQLARLKSYLRHNKKPLLVIQNLDVFSFQITHSGVYDPGQYFPYLGEPPLYAALARIDPEIWKARFVPLYGYAVEDLRFDWLLGVMGFLGWNPHEDHILGFRPHFSGWTDDFERFKAMNPHGVQFEIEPEGVAEMEGLLELCKEQGIKVLLVYSPEYVEMQRLTINRTAVFAGFDRLGDRYAAPVWDYSTSRISARQSNFYNSQHLNAQGAEEFSRQIAERIASDPVFGKLEAPPSRRESDVKPWPLNSSS